MTIIIHKHCFNTSSIHITYRMQYSNHLSSPFSIQLQSPIHNIIPIILITNIISRLTLIFLHKLSIITNHLQLFSQILHITLTEQYSLIFNHIRNLCNIRPDHAVSIAHTFQQAPAGVPTLHGSCSACRCAGIRDRLAAKEKLTIREHPESPTGTKGALLYSPDGSMCALRGRQPRYLSITAVLRHFVPYKGLPPLRCLCSYPSALRGGNHLLTQTISAAKSEQLFH